MENGTGKLARDLFLSGRVEAHQVLETIAQLSEDQVIAAISAIDACRRLLTNRRMQLACTRGIFYCVICREVEVAALAGFDTCSDCTKGAA